MSKSYIIIIETDDAMDKEQILTLLSDAEDEGVLEGPFTITVKETDDAASH